MQRIHPSRGPFTFHLAWKASHWTASRPFSFFSLQLKTKQEKNKATSRLDISFFCYPGGTNITNPLQPPGPALKDTRCSRVWTTCMDLLMKLKERGQHWNSERREEADESKWKEIKERQTDMQRKKWRRGTGGIARGSCHVWCACPCLSILALDPWQRETDCFDRSADITWHALLFCQRVSRESLAAKCPAGLEALR